MGSGGRGETYIGGGDRPLRTLEAEIGFSLTTWELGWLQGLAPIRGPGRKGLALVGTGRTGKGRGARGGRQARRKPERVL